MTILYGLSWKSCKSYVLVKYFFCYSIFAFVQFFFLFFNFFSPYFSLMHANVKNMIFSLKGMLSKTDLYFVAELGMLLGLLEFLLPWHNSEMIC